VDALGKRGGFVRMACRAFHFGHALWMGKFLYIDVARGTREAGVHTGFVPGFIHEETTARIRLEATLAVAGEAVAILLNGWGLGFGDVRGRHSEREY
jgi:hypothetical protein